MRMERSEALDIFKKWHAEHAVIRCQGSFPNHAFGMSGRITSLSDREMNIIADDKESEVVFQFDSVGEFGYGDSRSVTGREAEEFECCILIFMAPIPDEGVGDHIALAEVRGSGL